MKFEEPKVEIVKINTVDAVYASPVAGGTQTCVQSGGPCDIEAMLEEYE